MTHRPQPLIACAVAILALLGPIAVVGAETMASLRLMLHPMTAARGTLPADVKARLEAVAGQSLTLTGTTRTGALDLALEMPLQEVDAKAMLRAMRIDRGVLWAEPATNALAAKSAKSLVEDNSVGRRLLVRLHDDSVADWAILLPRLEALVGFPLTVERQITNVWVLSTRELHPLTSLTRFAARVQEDPAVQYADPVRRAYAKAAPNDPLYALQWALNDPISGVGAETAWTLQPDSSGVTVAVIDTGILPHPDLEGRLLPGYDFITDIARARDGDERDPNPRDEGDWSTGNCGSAQDSFFHGLFVAGLIAANTNNGQGIAGLANGAKILPVRTLGQCGGTFEDVLEGMLWSSGVRIFGVPANPNPAKVINMSLGGTGPCDQSIQEAIDDALAQGAVVVVSAGNDASDASSFTPANCSGVITVAAHTRAAGLASYSNFGRRIDLSAPGGDLPVDDLIISTHDSGSTVPQAPNYRYARGTSFSAPHVAGTAAMMLARNPTLTAGRLLDIVTGTARSFPSGSGCVTDGVCGSGMLDAAAAVGSTIPGGAPPPNASRVVEFYRADLDHYFITASPAEINYVDTFLRGTFVRTGLYFYAYVNPFLAPPSAQPVCRFYAGAEVFINSHYYTANFSECQFVLATWPGIWNLEQAAAFYVQVPDTNGSCPVGTTPVYRFFNNRRDANHRYTIDLSARRAMINRAWVPEGYGPFSAALCSPI